MGQLHFFFFPFMAHGHMIPTLDMAKLVASRGVKATIVTTPLNKSVFSKSIQRNKHLGLEIDIRLITFQAVENGLPEGCERLDLVPSQDLFFNFLKATAMMQETLEQLIEECRPNCLLTRTQLSPLDQSDEESVMSMMMKLVRESDLKSYRVIFNSFYELEDYVEHYTKVLGRNAWAICPLSLCNMDIEDKAERGKQSSIDNHECMKWLDSKKSSSVIYVCFGSIANFTASQLHELAMGIEASGQEFIWVVRTDQQDNKDWFPEGFEERTKEKGLIIRGWAPQVLILDHEAVGAFVTHCGWNSTLEGISAGIPMVTWPLSAEQFFNEKLVTEVLKTGVGLGSMLWQTTPCEGVKREAIAKAIKRVIVGEEAEEFRNRAKEYKEMARQAVEEGGSSYCGLSNLLHDLSTYSSTCMTPYVDER
ncbi:scopoletin glucosyltransferase-like [Nicotiana tabacum]|uniref:Scopoletin glucosyltransferase-like n=1 Tax=Nicotiana tabacum TaxID=4097 RepID=A0AC58UUS2_TOBAC